jgi:phosphatidylinositol glycan class V
MIAAPMLWLLLESSVTVLSGLFPPPRHGSSVPQTSATGVARNTPLVMHSFPELAIPQLVLAIAAITSFHVQIVNRIASGYPTWYTTIATWLVDESFDGSKHQRQSHWIICGMITYGLVQGMLFANFLPPA